MNEFTDKYDKIGEYNQGVAIVKKGNKYGAISKEGEIVIPIIYDELSDFVDGYTLAVYNEPKLWGNPLRYIENRLISTTGQVLVKNSNGNVLLPKEYEWGTDFLDGLSIVVKNRSIGVINTVGDILIPLGQYPYIDFMRDGLIRVSNLSLETGREADYSYLGIKNKVKELYYTNWGLLNSDGDILLPCLYHCIEIIKTAYSSSSNIYVLVRQGEKKFDGTQFNIKAGVFSIVRKQGSEDKTNLLVPIMYDQIKMLSVDEHVMPTLINATSSEYNFIYDTNGNLKFYYDNKNDEIVKTSFVNWDLCEIKLQTRLYYITKKGAFFEIDGGGLFKETSNGELYLLGLQYTQNGSSWAKKTYSTKILDLLDGVKVERDYLSYKFYDLGNKLLEVRYNNKCGISDMDGTVIVPIKYHNIDYVFEDCFIVSQINDIGELRYGAINHKNQLLLPLSYNYLGVLKNYFVYSNNAKFSNKKRISKYDSIVFDKNSLFGIIDNTFKILSLPIYNSIVDACGTCIKVCKDGKIGVLNNKGDMIIGFDEYDYVDIYNEDFIKVAKNRINDSKYVNGNNTYEKWGIIDPEGEDIVACMYSSLSIIYINDEYYILACLKIKADDMYNEYDIVTGVYDDWEKENYYYIKKNENNPKFGSWHIMDREGMYITDFVEGFEEDAKDALMAHLNNSSPDDDQEGRDISFSKYGGYNDWDDDSIDEAFDSDPELTWNVD
jgi:hypothetical protein